MGGLSKKSYLLKTLATSADILKVDAGSLFFDDNLTRQPQRLPQAIITASAIVDAYNHMDYDSIAVGRQDLAAGLDALKTLEQQASFPFLSANLIDTNGSLPFKPVVYVERAGMRIALIGLTDHTIPPETCSDSVKILPWQEVLPQMMAQISAQSDLVILLSNLSAPENRAIAQQRDDIHIIFQSGVSKQNMRPQLINNTLITQVGHQGKFQGQLTVHWTPARKWQQEEVSLLALQKEYDRLGWMIDKVRKKGGPQMVYKDNEARVKTFSQKVTRYKELEDKIKEMAKGEKKNALPQATYNNHFHPLPPSLSDDPAIIEILQNSRKKANMIRRQLAEQKTHYEYIGSNNCKSCHESIYLAWSQTPHASSYKTLQKRNQNNNLTCVYCHVTSLNEKTAYLASSLPENLKSVGCEVCHGPGKKHAADPRLYAPQITPDSKLCINCHNSERDNNFNYEQNKEKLH